MQDLKEFNSQSLATQAKKVEPIVRMMPAIKKGFNILDDDIVELTTENNALKIKIGDYDEKWLQDSKDKLLKQVRWRKKSKFICVLEWKSKWINNNTLPIYLIINYGQVNLMAPFPREINYKI